MESNIVLGSNLYDISYEVLQEIKQDSEKENLIIVPDRFSLLAETLLFDAKKINCTFNTFVMPISKFCIEKLREVMDMELISTQQQKFLIRRAITLTKDSFICFKNISTSFIDEISKTISQLKSCNIECEKLKYNNDSYLKNKIHDLSIIFEKYEELLAGRMDNNDILNIFISKISFLKINNYNYYFIGFDSLTSQTTNIIKLLIENGAKVTIGAPYSSKNSRNFDLDIYNKFCKERDCENINIRHAATNLTDKQIELCKYYSGYDCNLSSDYISLYQSDSIKTEIDFVLMDICKKIKTGYSCNDLAICCSSLEKYQTKLEDRLKDYKLPFFFDSAVKYNTTYIYNFTLSILDSIVENFKLKNLIALVNSFFFNNFEDEKTQIISLIQKYNLNCEKYENGCVMLCEEEGNVISKFFEKILDIKSSFKNCKIVHDYIFAIKNVMEKFNLELVIENICEKLDNDLKNRKIVSQTYDIFVETLDSLSDLIGGEECDIESFKNIFIDAFSDVKVSTVPISSDCIYIGDSIDSYFKQNKILYVMGCSGDNVPRIINDCGLILDDDIKKLADVVDISPTIKMINRRNRFKFFNNISSAQEKIKFSYSMYDDSSNMQKASSLITELCERAKVKVLNTNDILFVPNKTEALESLLYTCPTFEIAKERLFSNLKSDNYNATFLNSLFFALKDNFTENDLKRINYTNVKTKIADAKNLFFKNSKTKISQIEDYFTCPYKHFVDYGLKLKEYKNQVGAIEVGNLLHKIAQTFAENINQFISFEECESFVDQLFNEKKLKEFLPFLYSDENEMLLKYLHYESKSLVDSIFIQQKSSNLKIKETEFYINTEKYFDCGIGLKGFVDRIDSDDNTFIIIDYKSSNVNFNLNSVYCGEKIQVLLYAGVYEYLSNKKCAGCFYLPVKRDNNLSYHKFKGYYINNTSIALQLDNSLNFDNPSSNFFNIKLSTSKANRKSNNLQIAKTSSSSDSLADMIIYAKKICNQAIKEILSGNVECSPLKNSCSYCSFKGICDFNTIYGNKERTINYELKNFFGGEENE